MEAAVAENYATSPAFAQGGNLDIPAFGGPLGIRWDEGARATPGLAPVALTQLYRDRGDCENNFDEYKNQWGWSGFVTQKIKPTRAMARLIAIVANWWNVFCRLAEGGRHMEAITSRPMLMGIVGRIVASGRSS